MASHVLNYKRFVMFSMIFFFIIHSSLYLRGFVLGGFANSLFRPENNNTSVGRFSGSERQNCTTTRRGLRGVDCVWNVMAHAQKPYFVFRRNGRVHLNRRGRQFSRLLAAEVCASALVMLDTPCSEVVWRVLATHSIRSFPFTSTPVAVCHQVSNALYYLEVYLH